MAQVSELLEAGTTADAQATPIASKSAFYEELNEKYSNYGDQSVAILISDMEGFTQTTRRLGIVHFASMILRMRATLRPVWQQYGALHIFTEADNFWVIFPSAAAALNAALQAQHALADYNASIKNADFEIRLSGFGIEKGVGVWQDKHEGKFYGPTVDKAFHLGEDVVEGGGIALGEQAYAEVSGMKEFSHLRYEQDHDDDVTYWKVTGEQEKAFKLVDEADPNPGVEQLLSRTLNHMDEAKLTQIDTEVKKNLKKYAAVMYGCDWAYVAEKYDTEIMLVLRERCAELVKEQMLKHGGIRVEPNFFIFEDPVACVIASMNSREAIKKYNRHAITETGRDSGNRLAAIQIPFNGAGMHYGDMLFIQGTDVHWGDPVNTASKLGEDLAQDMHILVSEQLWDLVREASALSHFAAEKRSLSASKADLTCYSIAFKSQSGSLHKSSTKHATAVAADAMQLALSSTHNAAASAAASADADVIRRLTAMEDRFERLEKTQLEILQRLSKLTDSLVSGANNKPDN